MGNNKSATLTQYYDKWNITFASSAPAGSVVIPTLSTGSLLLLTALVMLAAVAARRRHS